MTELNSNPEQQPPLPVAVQQPESQHGSHSKFFKWLMAGLLELIVLIGVFALGLNIGFRKAGFTYEWIHNYPNNFAIPGAISLMPAAPPAPGQMFNDHGVFGTILSVDGSALTIKDSDSNEKDVMILPDTTIRQNYQNLPAAQLKANEEIVVIGSPDDQGRLQAKFIRILDQN